LSVSAGPAMVEHPKSSGISARYFVLVLLLLVGGAIVRSAISTRLDGFTIDEPYHIATGVSYVRYADFRINPEHPPLVKLWAGAFLSATGFHLNPIRVFVDKADERDFTEKDVYLNNDFHSVQRRSRVAMWTLNGLLLLFLAFAVRRAFGSGVALGTALFLAIDPTVAAHLPVVMTDLPVSLLSATAVILAIRALQGWQWKDLAACAIALGLALATKHSAPIVFIFVLVSGTVLALVLPLSRSDNSRMPRFVKLAAVTVGAVIILWSFYFFRFTESNAGRDVFNRALADKISDVRSPVYRFVLKTLATSHVVPRPYIWGFADTIRAGLEGRTDPITAFGRPYVRTAPTYFFPAVILLKLPIGLDLLVLIGMFFFVRRRLSPESNAGLSMVLAASALFLVVLASGSTYAGIRHALPIVVLLAIIGGVAIDAGVSSTSRTWKVVVMLALIVAAISALPVMRPWEYFNEIVGSKNAYLYFSDEGVDLSQRGDELEEYYHRVLEPSGEVPLLGYEMGEAERMARHLDWLGRDLKRDEARLNSPVFSGTILADARFLGKKPFWDTPSLRTAVPISRFGNLLIFRGTFPSNLAGKFYFDALAKIFTEKPDLETAERLLRQSLASDPTAFFVEIQLGNVCLKRGARECASRAYSEALQYAPNDSQLRGLIEAQIKRVSSEPLSQIQDLRDPFME
jgi:Dolichyl-phosphate-mannose-protein mannosyltransferase